MGGRQVRTAPAYGHIYDHFACEFEFKNGARFLSTCRHHDNTRATYLNGLSALKDDPIQRMETGIPSLRTAARPGATKALSQIRMSSNMPTTSRQYGPDNRSMKPGALQNPPALPF